jgi:hypothetical protein
MSKHFLARATRKLLRREVLKVVAKHRLGGLDKNLLNRTWTSLSANPIFVFALRRHLSTDDTSFYANAHKFLIGTSPELYNSVHISPPQPLIDELNKNSPFVAVQLHDGAPNLTKLLVDNQRSLSRIVSNRERHLKKLRSIGIDTSYVNVIQRDIKSLARLRDEIRRNRVICCAIDYKDDSGRWTYLSPAIFGVAQRLGVPVIYIKHDVDRHLNVQMWASLPQMVSDPTQSAMDFQTFYNSIPGRKANLSIRRYVG